MSRDTVGSILFVLIIIGCMLLFCGALLGVMKVVNEKSCNVSGEQYGLEADYRFFADTCFVTFPNGNNADVEKIRVNADGEPIIVD